ncbi:NUDIX domain-containing protein [uncultured Microbacterium sp.]|uniref:NUDIX domain-containing protein n=1 Tax=uncultured Microbacterium sp. TaxID=191216 RepID=UPI0028DCC32E|nr:NUDIX domain-containing protein [uncultured Microbacterium sp.]
MLSAVTAVIRDGERMLLARSAGATRWSFIGGGVEPGEHPADALRRSPASIGSRGSTPFSPTRWADRQRPGRRQPTQLGRSTTQNRLPSGSSIVT